MKNNSDYQEEVSKIISEFSEEPKIMLTNQYQRRRRPHYEDDQIIPPYRHKRQPERPRVISFDQWIFPHINSTWYDFNVKTNIAASGSSTVITFLATQDGIFRWFGHMVDNGSDAQLWEYGKWSLRKNGVNLQPWVNISQMVGLLNDPTLVFVPFVNGDIITVFVQNNDTVNSHDFYSRLKGWTFVY